MPWSQLSPMDQKTQFIADCLRRSLSVTELCEHYGISRKTGYKWIERYEQGVSLAWPSAPDARMCARPRRPRRWCRRSLKRASAIPPGVRRSCWRFFPGAIRIGLGRPAPPAATSSLGKAWFGNHGRAVARATPASLAPR